MRILMLNNEFPPLGGGMGTVNQALLRHLSQAEDLAIDLITSSAGPEAEEIRFSERIRILKVPVGIRNIHHFTMGELMNYALRAFPLARALHAARPYHLGFAWSTVPAGWVAWRLRRTMNLRYLIRVTGPDIPGFEERYRYVYPFLRSLIRFIWRRAEVVVAKCAEEEAMIRSIDGRAKILRVPNGVDLSCFHPPAPLLPDGPLRILCVARLIRRKGQDHLLRALQSLRLEGLDATLDLIGRGDEEESYRKLARQLRVEGQVRFLGYVPREEMPNHYRSAHVFVLPSYNEGMSVATLEAMAAGLPLILTRTGGTGEMVREKVNGFLFDRGDVASLTHHLRRLARDRELVKRMGKASLEMAPSFSWEKVMAEYQKLFEGLRGRRHSPIPRVDPAF
jgi:phosphatidylinositol alpha-1,6-mannosyltransferase